jgi:Txe/YoeB family toxin of Txe-Axe toxin-antitoxin module
MVNQMSFMSLKIIQHLKKNPWYEGSFELFEYDKFPTKCPWQKSQKKKEKDFIQKLFQSVASLIPSTVERLVENCKEIYALMVENEWFLVYAINEDKFLCGGEPNELPILPADAIADGWELPVELKTFYAVHNGFGVLWSLGMFWGSHGVLPEESCCQSLHPRH